MEFEKVRGQIESLWNEGLTEAGVRARRSGEAAGEERVLKALDVLIDEWRLDRPELVTELRRRLSLPEPEVLEERLTFAEWEERHLAALAEAEKVADAAVAEHLAELERDARRLDPPGVARREGDEERRVLVDRRGGEARLPEIAPDFEGERARQLAAEDAAQVFPPPVEATLNEDEPLAAQFGGSAASPPETVLEAEARAEAREQSAL